MIVDCHTHIGQDGDDVARSAHLAASETVDVCVVLAQAGESSDEVNKKLSDYVAKHTDKMVGFALVEPTEDKVSLSTVKSIKEKLGLAGAALYCSSCGFHPAHSRAMRFYEAAEELAMPVFFHNHCEDGPGGVLDYAQPLLLDEVARSFPALAIIVGNMGMPFIEQTLSLVAKHQNVYADLTIKPGNIWQVYNTIVTAHEHDVMDKLLFGSGFPVGEAGVCMETLLGFNKLLGDTNLPTVPRGSIRNIIERDTLQLLGIDRDA